MSYIYKLEIIDSKIRSLSFFKKVQLYLIPVFLLSSIFLLIPTSQNKSLLSIENKINKLKNRTNKKAYLVFIKEYSDYINKKGISLSNIEIKNSFIKLNINSSLSEILNFLFFIETSNPFSSFFSYKIKSLDKNFELELFVEYESFYIKKQNHNINDKLEFLKKKELNVDGYIDKYILINGNWLKVGDIFGSFEFIKIDKHYIYFKNNKKIIRILKNANLK